MAEKDSAGTQTKAPEYDWSGVNGQAVERLRAPKVYDVPAQIVKLAQASWEGQEIGKDEDGKPIIGHNMRHDFGKGHEEMAKAFAEHMKHAGDHTTPQTSLTVVVDPDGTGNEHVVTWKAGKRRGRTAA